MRGSSGPQARTVRTADRPAAQYGAQQGLSCSWPLIAAWSSIISSLQPTTLACHNIRHQTQIRWYRPAYLWRQQIEAYKVAFIAKIINETLELRCGYSIVEHFNLIL
jgi:hypothetical protein